MARAWLVIIASVSLSVAACAKPVEQSTEMGETSSSTTESPDLGGDGDGDGDLPLLDVCSWVLAPPFECDVAFVPPPPEPAPPAASRFEGVTTVDIIAHADAVEILYIYEYRDINDLTVGSRRYIASNAGGSWQHQFVYADPCDSGDCYPLSPARIHGSSNRTQITPPYMRREGGQWQMPVVDPHAVAAGVYADPRLFAVGHDDRSYLLERDGNLVATLWAETELGCHTPTWRLEQADCPLSYVAAMAVDAAGILHMTGAAQAATGDWRIVHWLALPDSIDGHELERLPPGDSPSFQDLAIGESGEIHLCHSELGNQVGVYGHGHDASDWTTIEIDEPVIVSTADPTCKLALAPDGTVWLTWAAGALDETDPLRVASVVDDVISYETVEVGAKEAYVNLTVDPSGRPWIVYKPLYPSEVPIKVAHKDGDQWIVEEIAVP